MTTPAHLQEPPDFSLVLAELRSDRLGDLLESTPWTAYAASAWGSFRIFCGHIAEAPTDRVHPAFFDSRDSLLGVADQYHRVRHAQS